MDRNLFVIEKVSVEINRATDSLRRIVNDNVQFGKR